MKNFIIILSLLFIFCIALYPPIKKSRHNLADLSLDDWIVIMMVVIAMFAGVIVVAKLIFGEFP